MNDTLTAIPGLKVGHWTNLEAATGCTVILCQEGAVAGVDVRGGAPGTREVALLDPVCMVEKIHGLLLAGGSAYGLAAADGVMRWLEEQGVGYDVGIARVPIVPAAILFDLPVGRADVRPDAHSGYAACVDANEMPVHQGCVGAGTGATVGKMLGLRQAMKGGLGSACRTLSNGIIARSDVEEFVARIEQTLGRDLTDVGFRGGNTTLAVVATNAALSKSGCTKMAQMAHDGLARSINPVHTNIDGDIVFALSHGTQKADVGLLGALAADVLAEAVVRGVQAATSMYGLPCAGELKTPVRLES